MILPAALNSVSSSSYSEGGTSLYDNVLISADIEFSVEDVALIIDSSTYELVISACGECYD